MNRAFCITLQLKLTSDRITFNECAKKSRQQLVTLVENATFMSQWYAHYQVLFLFLK